MEVWPTRATAQVPAAKWTNVVNAAPDNDGSLAIAVEYQLDKLHAGGVAVFDPTGHQTAFIDTGANWSPTQLCFGPDHSIWAIGWRDLYSLRRVVLITSFFGISRATGGFLVRFCPGRPSKKSQWAQLSGVGSFAARMAGSAGFSTPHRLCRQEL